MKKLMAILLALAMLMTLAACTSGTTTDGDKAADTTTSTGTTTTDTAEQPADTAAEWTGATIGVAVPDFTIPFFSKMVEGMKAAAEEYNITLDIQDAANDASLQTSQIENFITKGVDMVIMLPAMTDVLIPVAKELNEAGVPFITDNRALTSGASAAEVGVDMITYVGCDDFEGGRRQGELLVNLIGTSGKVAVLAGKTGSSGEVMRKGGLEEYLAENAPDIEIVAYEDCEWDASVGMTVTENLLTRFAAGELDAIVSHDPYVAASAVSVIRSAGRDDLLGRIIAYDYPQEVKDAIAAGDLYGTVIQAPYEQGVLGVEVCYQYLTEGRDNIPENVYTDLPIVDINTVDQYEVAW